MTHPRLTEILAKPTQPVVALHEGGPTMTATPKQLKAMREAKRLDLFYIADRLHLDPMTLAAVEAEDVRAMEPLLEEWWPILDSAPEYRPA